MRTVLFSRAVLQVDLATPTGDDIPIEERPGERFPVLEHLSRPGWSGVANPAFDVTLRNI